MYIYSYSSREKSNTSISHLAWLFPAPSAWNQPPQSKVRRRKTDEEEEIILLPQLNPHMFKSKIPSRQKEHFVLLKNKKDFPYDSLSFLLFLYRVSPPVSIHSPFFALLCFFTSLSRYILCVCVLLV